MTHEVYFILDTRFQGDLWELSRSSHVWLVDSPANAILARAVWDRETDGYSPRRGVSTFTGSESAIESFYGFLGTIDEHHNEFSASSPWGAIHVKGVSLGEVEPDRVAEELGLDEAVLEAEGEGFAIRPRSLGA
jgi:hypothetical protein